jgi:hypothetical protein
MFSDAEKLHAIGKMNKEIEGSGYVFKTNKRRYALVNDIILFWMNELDKN